jgi:hypothetical protein
MRLSTFSTEDAQVRGYAVALASRASHQTVGMRAFCLSIAIALTTGACVSSGGLLDKKAGPIGEAELAAKKLQEPLDKHLCKAAIYPVARPDWKISRVQSLQGRGPSFQAALEALCREADGQKFPAHCRPLLRASGHGLVAQPCAPRHSGALQRWLRAASTAGDRQHQAA